MLKCLFLLQLEKRKKLFLFLLNFILKVVAFAVYVVLRLKDIISSADISMDRNFSREFNVNVNFNTSTQTFLIKLIK